MSDTSQGPGWWEASDGKWYPPESHPDQRPDPPSDVRQGPIGKPRSTGLTILVSIVTFGIWTLVWSYWNGEELKGYRNDGLGGIVFLIFTFFFFPITMFVMANEVEQMYKEEGEDPLITTLWGLWFLLPVIGQIIWYVRIQRAINEFWQARGGTRSPGLT
ncbi:MAG: DUF4234 domain-containing protein [Acidimicrobiales bacterium]